MRVQCDVCERAPASVMCCADEAALCVDCDLRVHAANKLANKHHRVPLLGNVGDSPRCDICQEKNGFFFCLEDRALLCRECDVSIHSVNHLSSGHQRFLVPGTRVALEALRGEVRPGDAVSEDAVHSHSHSHSHSQSHSQSHSHSLPLLPPVVVTSPSVSGGKLYQVPKASPPPPPPPPPAAAQPASSGVSTGRNAVVVGGASGGTGGGLSRPTYPALAYGQFSQGGNGGVARRSSISEYLTEGVPGWRVEELLNIPELADGYSLGDVCSSKADVPNLGDFDWTADLSLFDEQVYAESLHEVPQLSSAASGLSSRPGRVNGTLKGKGKQDMALVPEFDDAFLVPDLGLQSAPASPPLAKRRRVVMGI